MSSSLRVCMSVFAVVVCVFVCVSVYFSLCKFVWFLIRCATISSFSVSNRGLVGGFGMQCKLQIPLFLQIVFHVTGGFISLATDIYPQPISEVNLFLIDFFC